MIPDSLRRRRLLARILVAGAAIAVPVGAGASPEVVATRGLPSSVTARVSVEAGLALSWYRYLGTRGRAVSIEHFGASADYKTLFREFGITAEAVVAAAKESLASA